MALPWRRSENFRTSFPVNPVSRIVWRPTRKPSLDQAGENVAFAGSLDQAQDSLMHSPPHRANLLNADYNVAGFSVVRSGSLLYVTQDFGHSLPSHSDEEAEVLVGRSVDRIRAQGTPSRTLQRMDSSEAAASACAMAEGRFVARAGAHSRVVLRYTTPQPQTLPAKASQVIGTGPSLFRRRCGSVTPAVPPIPPGCIGSRCSSTEPGRKNPKDQGRARLQPCHQRTRSRALAPGVLLLWCRQPASGAKARLVFSG